EMAATVTRGAVSFPRRVAALLRAGLDLRDRYPAGGDQPARRGRGPWPPGEPTVRLGLPAQGERGQRAPGPAAGGSPRRPLPSPASAGAGRHQLACGTGDPIRRHPAEGLGRQPDLGWGAGAVGTDVGVADVLAAGAFGPGLPQSPPAGSAAGSAFTTVAHGAKP